MFLSALSGAALLAALQTPQEDLEARYDRRPSLWVEPNRDSSSCQGGDHMLEGSVAIFVLDAQHAGDVLPQRPPQPALRKAVHDPDVVGEQLRLAMLQPGPLPRHREPLTGRTASQHIDRLHFGRVEVAYV